MSRILLADDSPHAQRMGEFILREEGYEVVSVTDGETVLVRLDDVDPDLILADVSLPGKNGYQICEYVKNHTRHHNAGVLLTAGVLEAINEEEAQRVRADGCLRKPFEASVVLDTVKRVVEAALHRGPGMGAAAPVEPPPPPVQEAEPEAQTVNPPGIEPETVPEQPQEVPEPVIEVQVEPAQPPALARPAADPQSVRAAVTLALEAALPVLIDEVTQRVLLALAEEAAPSKESFAVDGASAD
jgi:CheY-like chemotaxis protein